MKKGLYYAVYEYPESAPKRLIYTFATDEEAHDLVEFILRRNMLGTKVGVEEHEAST